MLERYVVYNYFAMIPKKASFLWEQFWDFFCCCPFWNRFGWRPPATEKLQKSIDAFCKIIQAEDRLLILLSRRWIPVLCAFAGSSMWEPLEGYVSEPHLFVIFPTFYASFREFRVAVNISYLFRDSDQTCQMPLSDAPPELREAVLSLQSDFAVPDSRIAKMALRLARIFHRSGQDLCWLNRCIWTNC